MASSSLVRLSPLKLGLLSYLAIYSLSSGQVTKLLGGPKQKLSFTDEAESLKENLETKAAILVWGKQVCRGTCFS